ncbi:MAG TPA: PhnD/SsuA/transferrin family substrate-binding protein [Myxococcota bacterium]
MERQGPRRVALLLAGSLGLLAAASPASADDTSPIEILVLKEHGVGSPSLAQPYVDRFVALAAEDNGWSAAKGQYLSSRSAAETFIKNRSPKYGILSLAAFLALRERYQMEVLGRVASKLAGGEQYFIVSRSARDLAGCKGHKLASDHFADARFVEKVVARGDFKLAEFQLVKNQRPLQSLRQVLSGDVDCALLDDAQLAELQHLQGADSVKTVWKSKPLPPMAVVAFASAPIPQRKAFKANLSSVCEGPQNTACAEVGIHALAPARTSDYAEVMALYAR